MFGELPQTAELLAMWSFCDLELDLDRVGRRARADGERAGADRAALARAGGDAGNSSVFLEEFESERRP